MAGSAGFLRFTLQPGEAQAITVQAEFICCLAATAAFEIVADDVNRMFMQEGISYVNAPGEFYSRLRVVNTSAAPNEIFLQFGPGELRDQRLTVSGAVSVVTPPGQPLEVTQADQYAPRENMPDVIERGVTLSVPGGTSSQVYGANPDRHSCIVENLSTETMVISDSTGTLNHGIPVRPGERLEIRSKGAIWVANPASFTQDLGRCEIRWS